MLAATRTMIPHALIRSSSNPSMKDFLDLSAALDSIIKPVVSPGGLVCAMLHVSNSVTILYHRQKVHACGHFSSSPRGYSPRHESFAPHEVGWLA